MQSNISSAVPFVDIVLILAALAAVFISLYMVINFIKQNPHILAWAGLVAIVFGGVFVVSDTFAVMGGLTMLSGAFALLLAAIISATARNKSDKAMVAKSYKKLVNS